MIRAVRLFSSRSRNTRNWTARPSALYSPTYDNTMGNILGKRDVILDPADLADVERHNANVLPGWVQVPFAWVQDTPTAEQPQRFLPPGLTLTLRGLAEGEGDVGHVLVLDASALGFGGSAAIVPAQMITTTTTEARHVALKVFNAMDDKHVRTLRR